MFPPSLASPLLIGAPLPGQRSYICVLVVLIGPLSTIFLLDFGNVPTVCYLFCFLFHYLIAIHIFQIESRVILQYLQLQYR
jgi:hypothetical protein